MKNKILSNTDTNKKASLYYCMSLQSDKEHGYDYRLVFEKTIVLSLQNRK